MEKIKEERLLNNWFEENLENKWYYKWTFWKLTTMFWKKIAEDLWDVELEINSKNSYTFIRTNLQNFQKIATLIKIEQIPISPVFNEMVVKNKEETAKVLTA